MVAKYSTTKNRGIQTHTGNGSLLKLNSVNAVKLEKFDTFYNDPPAFMIF